MSAEAVRTKGLGVTRISDPYEPLQRPEVVVRTHPDSLEGSARKILAVVDLLDYLPASFLKPAPVSLAASE